MKQGISESEFIGLFNIRTIGTVQVTGNRSEMVDFGKQAGHFVFNPIRFSDLPNFGETDVFRALQLLPGIGSAENSSQLNIRGGSADQNLVMFDGYTLYNLDHFFGVFSALNPNVIKNIQVYRGGFDSRYGERVSGIVDITGKSGNQYKPLFYGGVNLISGNLTAEVPVTKKLTVIAAGRRAYSDLYSSFLADALLKSKLGEIRIPPPGLNNNDYVNEIEPDFYFSDYNLKATFTPNSSENFSFSVYGAKDFLDNSNYYAQNQDEVDVNTKDISKWGNYGLGASWKRQWNPKFFTDVQAGHSGYFNDYYNKIYVINQRTQTSQQPHLFQDTIQVTNENNDLIDYFFSVRNSFMINQRHHFEFGAGAKFNQFTYYKDGNYNDNNPNQANSPFIYADQGSSGMLYSLFFQDRVTTGKKLELKPGLRVNLYGNTGKFYLEPRFLANYNMGSRVFVKMATGRYFQFLNKPTSEQSFGYNRNFWVLADGVTHPVVSSNHFIVGGTYTGKYVTFDVEGYYKTIDGIQEYLFFALGENPGQKFPPAGPGTSSLSRFVTGKGKAYGLDFLLKYEKGNFISWAAYSISKSFRNYKEINNNDDIPAPFDQTHDFKWTNLYSIKNWNFSSLTLFYTGHPYLKSTLKDGNFKSTRTYGRLPDYFRIDLSANYNLYIKKVYLKPGISIINALNTRNYFDIYTRPVNIPGKTFNIETRVKGQELTFNFFINFRF